MKQLLLLLFLAGSAGVLYGQAVPDTLKTATLKVTGITCQGDMPVIKKKLINQDGIDEVEFTEAKGGMSAFTVRYHTSVIGEAEILALIESSPCCDNPNEFPYKAKAVAAKPKKK
jgi:copper chaperone CopZ